MVALKKQRAELQMPTEAGWDQWARKFSRQSMVNGAAWSLVDIFRDNAVAKAHFRELCDNGCNPEWLANNLMRLPALSSGKTGTKPFGMNARQAKVLRRIQKDLRLITKWDSIPMLIAPGAGETVSVILKAKEFESELSDALKALPTNHIAGFSATNAQALAVTDTVRGIVRQTGRPHFESARILFDAVLTATGRTDLFNNQEKLKKIVKRYSRNNSK